MQQIVRVLLLDALEHKLSDFSLVIRNEPIESIPITGLSRYNSFLFARGQTAYSTLPQNGKPDHRSLLLMERTRDVRTVRGLHVFMSCCLTMKGWAQERDQAKEVPELAYNKRVPLKLRSFFCALTLILGALALGAGEPTSSTSGAKPLVPNNRWAVVIGVSSYSDEIGALKYTAKEARDFASTLTGDLQFDPANVKLLADAGTPEEKPTSAHIMSALDTLLADPRLDKANLFVFYFSGHGVGTPDGDLLLPSDTRKDGIARMGVPVREVIARIVSAGLKNVLFIADACRAGVANDFGEDLTALCHKANIAVILGCAPGKRSYEYAALKQGAFTHFLLEGLKGPSLRDSAGVLWASRLGQDVQTKVHEYTEPDHGKFAQVPALWAEQSTLDVLLGAYPQPPVSDDAIRKFTATAQKLGKDEYVDAMIGYAMALYGSDRTDEAVEMLKAASQLGELTPLARVTLAVALDELGRTGEAERVYAAFRDMPDGYWKDFGLAICSSRDLDPNLRLKAAMRLLETDPVWEEKMMAWGVVDLWGNYEQKLKCAKYFASVPTDSVRRRQYAAGQLAIQQGRWADAVKAFDAARKADGTSPDDYVIYLAELQPIIAVGNDALLQKYLDEGAKIPKAAAFAYLEKAMRAKNKGDAKARVALLKIALAKDINANHLLLAAKIAGPYMGLLTEEFKAAASKYPYSWRCRMVLYFVRRIQGEKQDLNEDAMAADRYMDDPLTFNSKLFDFMESYMSEAVQLGTLNADTYRSQLDFYFLTLKDQAARFGFDPDLWMQLTQYGMFNERNAQVNFVVAKNLPFKPERAPKDLKPVLLTLAMNRGDAVTVDKLMTSGFEPTERADPTWFEACYEVTRGRWKKAAALIKTVGPPSEELRSRMEALRTYLLAKSGKLAEARKRLPKSSDDAVVNAWTGLTWAELGDWKKAEPLLAQQAKVRVWTFLFIQEYAMRVIDQRYRQTGRLAQARDLALSAMLSQPGNPLFARYSFAAKAGVAQFAGKVDMKGATLDDRNPNLAGRLRFAIQPNGTLTAAFDEDNGKSHAFIGRVDALGNVSGKVVWNGLKCALTGKIAPAALYKTYDGFSRVGQVLQLIDEEGFRIALLGRT